MATLLKSKDAHRNPKTGLELGICAATIAGISPGFTLAHNIMPPGYRSSTHSHTKVCRGTYVAKGRIRFFFGADGPNQQIIDADLAAAANRRREEIVNERREGAATIAGGARGAAVDAHLGRRADGVRAPHRLPTALHKQPSAGQPSDAT